MKLQTDKFKKYKSLKLWKNFNFFDFALLIVILFIAGSIAYYSPVSNLLKIAIFSSIVILNAPLFIEIPGKNARGYVVLAWIFIHLIRVKKFKKENQKWFSTQNLNTLYKIENNIFQISYLNGLLNLKNKSNAMVLEVFGKDITVSKIEEQELYLQKLTDAFTAIDNKIFIIKIPKFAPIKKNQKNLEKITNNKYFEQLKINWENDLKIVDNYQKIDKYYIVILNADKDKLKQELYSIQFNLHQSEIESEILSKRKLINFLNDLYLFGNDLSNEDIEEILETGDLSKFFAYENIDFKEKHFLTNGIYNSVQSIASFPLKLSQNWIKETFNSDSTIVWSLTPLDEKKKDKILNAVETNMAVNAEGIFNKMLKRRQQNNQEALENVSEAVASNSEQLFESSLMLWNRAFDLETLKAQEKENEINIKKWKGVVNNLRYRQIEAYSALLLKDTDILQEYTEQLSGNIGYGWVFSNQYLNDSNFSLLGFSIFNKNTPVFFDPSIKSAKRINQNMFVLGTSGSGKSTFCKKLLAPRVAINDKVIILDPQGEYKKTMNALGGKTIKLGVAEDLRFNPLQIIKLFNPKQDPSYYTNVDIQLQNEEVLTLNEDFIREWFSLLYPHFEALDIQIIVSSLKKVWEKFGFFNSQSDITKWDNNQYPLMSDLINELKKVNKNDLFFQNTIRILKTLELDFQANGRFNKLYNQYTNIDLNDNLIVFDTSALMNQKIEVKNSSFYLIISFIKGLISETYKKDYRIWLLIDEAHKFIDENSISTLDFIYQVVKEGRKYNCGTIITTQNPQDFTKTEAIKAKGQAILENCQYSVFLKLTPTSVESVNDLFEASGGLSETEKSFLVHASVGQGIISLNSSSRIAIDTYYNDVEKELFFESGDLRKYE